MLSIGIGIGLARSRGGGAPVPSYDPAAEALFARLTVQPDDARKALINWTILSLKASGAWSRKDALYVTAAHHEQAALLNWIQDAYNLTPVNAPVFTVDRGFQGDGVAAHLLTGFTPSEAGGRYQLHDAHASVWILDNPAPAATYIDLGVASLSANKTRVNSRRSASAANVATNTSSIVNNSGSGITTSEGLTQVNRSVAASNTFAKDRQVVATTINTASTGLPTQQIALLREEGLYSPRLIASAALGSSLNTSDLRYGLYDALQGYLQGVGAV